MKKIVFLLALIITVTACSVGDDTDRNFTVLPISTVDVPNKFKVDSISTFKIGYKRDNSCQIFNGIYFEPQAEYIDVAIKIVVLQESGCQPDDETMYEVPLYFKPEQPGTYILKFWNGKDPNGQDQFTNTEVIVP